jgi:hypothetical protein
MFHVTVSIRCAFERFVDGGKGRASDAGDRRRPLADGAQGLGDPESVRFRTECSLPRSHRTVNRIGRREA